jgi:tetratricopeptide (TPR) repeat protein
MDDYAWLAPLIAFIVPAIGWLFRELHFRRERKGKATADATQILKDQIADLEKRISKTDNSSRKKELRTQLDRKNDQLRGLNAINLRRTLKDAGLSEDLLAAEGKAPLKPQQVNELKREIAAVESLPPSDSIPDLLTLANAYYYSGQYKDAKDLYDKILTSNPDDHRLTRRYSVIGVMPIIS